MNIPEIRNDLKQEYRSDNASSGKAMGDSTAKVEEGRHTPQAVHKSEETQADKQHTQLSSEQVKTVTDDMEKKLEDNNVKLSFNVIEEEDTVQVEIIDAEGKIIRKIPSDEAIKLSESLKNLERGFLDEVS